MARMYAVTVTRAEAAHIGDVLAMRQEEEGLPVGHGFTIVENTTEDVRVEMDDATLDLLTEGASQDVYVAAAGEYLIVDGTRVVIEIEYDA